jgi:hypothetical protein
MLLTGAVHAAGQQHGRQGQASQFMHGFPYEYNLARAILSMLYFR